MFGWKVSALLIALAMLDPFRSTALVPIQLRQAFALRNQQSSSSTARNSSTTPNGTSTNGATSTDTSSFDAQKNRVFIQGLMNNLGKLCDRYICNGSPKTREQVFNVLDQIAAAAVDQDELVRQSIRMVKRAGVPM